MLNDGSPPNFFALNDWAPSSRCILFATVEETAQWFASGEFDKNPVGIVFDPDELIEKFESGTPVSELTRRPPLPEGVTPFDMVRT